MEEDVGYRVIAGDFNFITRIQLDKRGGNTKNGTIGRKEQREIEKKYEVRDIWREQNPETVGTTWSNGIRDVNKRVRTRIDFYEYPRGFLGSLNCL